MIGLEYAEGPAEVPLALANQDPTRRHDGQESRYDLHYNRSRLAQEAGAPHLRWDRPWRYLGSAASGALSGGRPVTDLYCIVWAVITAVTVWGIATTRTSAAVARLRADMRKEIAYLEDETSRARTAADQITRDTATWADAWKKGRDDVLAVIPMIISAHGGGGSIHTAADNGADTT